MNLSNRIKCKLCGSTQIVIMLLPNITLFKHYSVQECSCQIYGNIFTLNILVHQLLFHKNFWLKFLSVILKIRLKHLKRVTDLIESFHICRWQMEEKKYLVFRRELCCYSPPIQATQESFVSLSTLSLSFIFRLKCTETTT